MGVAKYFQYMFRYIVTYFSMLLMLVTYNKSSQCDSILYTVLLLKISKCTLLFSNSPEKAVFIILIYRLKNKWLLKVRDMLVVTKLECPRKAFVWAHFGGLSYQSTRRVAVSLPPSPS